MPDVAVAAVLVDALHDGFDGIDLVRPHHQQPLFAGHQHHVAADHLAQGALGQELLSKAIKLRDLLVVLAGELVDRQEAFISVEAEVPCVVVGEVPSIGAVADNEELQEAQQCLAVSVARIGLVIDDLLHSSTRADGEGLQLNLHYRDAVYEQHHVVAMVAVVGIDA
ncbi:hypothetical protein D9M68_680850 [compost metagenome]